MAREKIKKVPLLAEQEIAKYQREVELLAEKHASPEEIQRDYRDFLPDKPLGRAICESYHKEDLTLILKSYADKLGHAPAMHEVFPLYRSYIKRRFGTWPKALREAGLRHGLDGCERETDWSQLLREEPEIGKALVRLSERRRTLGYPPIRKEIPDSGLLKERFGDWNTVLSAAEDLNAWLEANPVSLAPACAAGLPELTALAEQLGRTPLAEEVPEKVRVTARLQYGSWREALHAAGLPALTPEETQRAHWEFRQRKRAGSCRLYLVKERTDRQTRLLKELEDLCGRYGRVPVREEVSGQLWDDLIQEFSSWRNALFQLQKTPLSSKERRAK